MISAVAARAETTASIGQHEAESSSVRSSSKERRQARNRQESPKFLGPSRKPDRAAICAAIATCARGVCSRDPVVLSGSAKSMRLPAGAQIVRGRHQWPSPFRPEAHAPLDQDARRPLEEAPPLPCGTRDTEGDSPDAVLCGYEQPPVIRAAEGAVGGRFRGRDLSQECAGRREGLHPVARRGPQVSP